MGRTTHNPIFKGKAITSDYTVTNNDFAIGGTTSSGDIAFTIPTASTIGSYPRSWLVKKMSQDSNRLIVRLETPADSMFGAQFSSMVLTAQGSGVEIILNANGKYTFSDWSGVDNSSIYTPAVTTLQPSLVTTTLTLNGEITEMGAETSLNARFRYRDMTIGGAWIETSDVAKTSVGAYSDTVTVTAAHIYETQAMIETSVGFIYYGAVLDNDINYYLSVTEAAADDLERYWSMQETSGTDTTAGEVMASDDMTMYNGVTIGNDTINSNTIYKRIFGTSDYGQAGYQPDWTWAGSSKTILLQVDMNSASGDHTILNFGRNILSLASDGSGVQIEINNSIYTWSSATPFSGILNIFITVDRGPWLTSVYTCTISTRTLRASNYSIPDNAAQYTRLGRGASGDANHQDTEYADDMIVRSMAVWGRVLSEQEMKDICDKLDTDGELIVA